VSRAVASTGIKAVLSGAGGDELFGGYPTFARLPRALAARRLTGPFWPIVASAGRLLLPERLGARFQYFAASDGGIVEAYRVQRAFMLPRDLARLAGPALREPAVWSGALEEIQRAERGLLGATGPETPYASTARLESRLYLQSQLLRDLDVMAMAHGLEVRVPFVDDRLIAIVWPELGRHRSLLSGKRLLHATLARPLPAQVVNDPKQGFTLPFARWMRGELGGVVQDGMAKLAGAGWIAGQAPAQVWSEWQSGRSHWSRPWGLGILGHFLDASRG
jgi:asparagine synthase (glutamine-hydrolysing)